MIKTDKIFLPVNYDHFSLKKSINTLCQRYTFVRKKSIGKSCLGKDIFALSIGSSQSYCLISAAFHGSEHITTNVLMMWFEDICAAFENGEAISGINIRKALSIRGLIIIPRVNPDGCDISVLGKKACGEKAFNIAKMTNNDFSIFNANYRGVDINHNFDANWKEVKKCESKMGIISPNYTRFGGYSPESEPETKALCDLCRNGNISQVMALHSQGQVIYWSFGGSKPKNSRKIAEILSTASGYSLDYPIAIADGGGFKDWFIKEFNRPGFTVEIGKGKNPLPIQTAEKLYFETKNMLTLWLIV